MRREKMKKYLTMFIVSALCAVIGISVSGETADSFEEKLKEGIRLHNEARLDPAVNIEKSRKILGDLMDKSPVAKAYYGSLITIEAGLYAEKKNGIRALSLLDEGTHLIDEAVRMAPDDPDLHLLRMINSYGVSRSSPLNRYQVMKKDIDWLDERQLSPDPVRQGVIELYRGLYLARSRRIDEALEAFEACVTISPGSSEAAEAERQLMLYAE